MSKTRSENKENLIIVPNLEAIKRKVQKAQENIQVFNSDTRQELAIAFNKANIGNPVDLVTYNHKKEITGINDLSCAYVVKNYIGKDEFVYCDEQRLWIRQTGGIYSEIKESEVFNIIKTITCDIVKLSEEDGNAGMIIAAKFVKLNFLKAVFEIFKHEAVGNIIEDIPEGICIIEDRAYDLNKKVYLDTIDLNWRAKPGLPFEPGDSSDGDFKTWISGMCREDGVISLQKYAGSLLYGANYTKKFILMEGAADSGKTAFTDILEQLFIDKTGHLRGSKIGGNFELGRLYRKDLISSPDVDPKDFTADAANQLKRLVGGDMMEVEFKGSNKIQKFSGRKHIIIACNEPLEFPEDHDPMAYVTRCVRIPCKIAYSKVDTNYAENIVKREGSQIVKWILEGVDMYLQDIKANGKFTITDAQKDLVLDMICAEKENVLDIIKDRFIPDATGFVSKSDASEKTGINNKILSQLLNAHYGAISKVKKVNGKSVRCYTGISFK